MDSINKEYSLKNPSNRGIFLSGVRNGIPIALGYLAVSFSLGIAAKKAGLNAFQGWLTSILCNASAGESLGFSIIGEGGTYIAIMIGTFVANIRYLLMSCAISQRIHPKLSILHRMGVAFCLTDEIFGISIARQGYINPNYTYGAMVISTTGWSVGTALGIIAGTILPARLVSAFSVALYGMFLAIIIPPARKNKVVAALIAICFFSSFLFSVAPLTADMSEGTRTIILTIIISAGAAILFPKTDEEEQKQ